MSKENQKNPTAKGITLQLVKTAMTVAIMAIVSIFVKIPFFPVPLTFQTTIAIMAGFILGWKYGIIAMSVYMFMGLIGIPVFSGLPPSFAAIMKPSFGYVLGFIATAGLVGFLKQCVHITYLNFVWIALIGVFINYIVGLPYFMLIVNTIGIIGQEGISATSMTVLWTYNLIYMPKDILLALLAAILSYKILPIINK